MAHEESGPFYRRGDAAILARNAYITQVVVDLETARLGINLLLSKSVAGSIGAPHPAAVSVTIEGIQNVSEVEAFLYRASSGVKGHIDKVLEFTRTTDGCSVELLRRGRLEIQGSKRVVVGSVEAAERGDAPDRALS